MRACPNRGRIFIRNTSCSPSWSPGCRFVATIGTAFLPTERLQRPLKLRVHGLAAVSGSVLTSLGRMMRTGSCGPCSSGSCDGYVMGSFSSAVVPSDAAGRHSSCMSGAGAWAGLRRGTGPKRKWHPSRTAVDARLYATSLSQCHFRRPPRSDLTFTWRRLPREVEPERVNVGQARWAGDAGVLGEGRGVAYQARLDLLGP